MFFLIVLLESSKRLETLLTHSAGVGKLSLMDLTDVLVEGLPVAEGPSALGTWQLQFLVNSGFVILEGNFRGKQFSALVAFEALHLLVHTPDVSDLLCFAMEPIITTLWWVYSVKTITAPAPRSDQISREREQLGASLSISYWHVNWNNFTV